MNVHTVSIDTMYKSSVGLPYSTRFLVHNDNVSVAAPWNSFTSTFGGSEGLSRHRSSK